MKERQPVHQASYLETGAREIQNKLHHHHGRGAVVKRSPPAVRCPQVVGVLVWARSDVSQLRARENAFQSDTLVPQFSAVGLSSFSVSSPVGSKSIHTYRSTYIAFHHILIPVFDRITSHFPPCSSGKELANKSTVRQSGIVKLVSDQYGTSITRSCPPSG